MRRVTWKPTYCVTIYALAVQGASRAAMAKALGVNEDALSRWIATHPEAKDALTRGQELARQRKSNRFLDFCRSRLDPSLQETWDRLQLTTHETNAQTRFQILTQRRSVAARQQLFVLAMVKHNFKVLDACAEAGVAKSTIHMWLNTDLEFRKLLDELEEYKKDYFEGALIDLVSAREPGAVIFANRTLNRDRGYNEKFEFEHTGQVNHVHAHVSFDQLELPLSVRRAVLEAYEKQQSLLSQTVDAEE